MWTSVFWAGYWSRSYWTGPSVAVSASDFVAGNRRVFTIRGGSAEAIENHDGGLGMEVGEELLFDFDFSRRLVVGDAISGTPSITVEPAGPSLGDVVTSSPRAQVRIGAGVTPGSYVLECVASTANGETVRGRGTLVVRADT